MSFESPHERYSIDAVDFAMFEQFERDSFEEEVVAYLLKKFNRQHLRTELLEITRARDKAARTNLSDFYELFNDFPLFLAIARRQKRTQITLATIFSKKPFKELVNKDLPSLQVLLDQGHTNVGLLFKQGNLGSSSRLLSQTSLCLHNYINLEANDNDTTVNFYSHGMIIEPFPQLIAKMISNGRWLLEN